MSDQIEFSEQDVEDLATIGITSGDEPSFHPILQVWREVLKPAEDEKGETVTAGFANRILSAYQGIGFGDMEEYRDRYFDKILELRDILVAVIASDDDCLKASTPQEDVEFNSAHYKQVLLDWQLAIVQWEKDWRTTAPDAAIELAAISEVHKMFFGQTGLTAFLDNIPFEFTDADRQHMADSITELKDRKDDGE